MKFRRFSEWADRGNARISLKLVLLVSCLFTFLSILNHNGGILHNEMELRLPFYLSDKPLLNKLFDSRGLELDTYRARELSYFFDFIDSKFVQFSVEHGFPHFLSLSHYLLSIATGCLLWIFCVRELKLKPWVGMGWLALFWTSPSIFLGGVLFRTGKIWVAFLTGLLFFSLYKIIVPLVLDREAQISKKTWWLYSIATFMMMFLDEQGLFINISALFFLVLWGGVFRQKKIYLLIAISTISLGIHGLYRYILAPQLTFILNGYWPNFAYFQQLPLVLFLQNIFGYVSAGVFLYLETFSFLTGNLPLPLAIVVFTYCLFIPFVYHSKYSFSTAEDRKAINFAIAGLLITNLVMVILMNALMVMRHPPLLLPDVRRVYYWLPTNIMLAMTFGILTSLYYKTRMPRWLIPIALSLALIGNIAALPGHKAILMDGHLKQYYQSSPVLLTALKELGQNTARPAQVEQNPVYQFFRDNQ